MKDHLPGPAVAPPSTVPRTVTRRISIEANKTLSETLDTGHFALCSYLAFRGPLAPTRLSKSFSRALISLIDLSSLLVNMKSSIPT
jgi:hypothetical protein